MVYLLISKVNTTNYLCSMKLLTGLIFLVFTCQGLGQEAKPNNPVISRYMVMTGTIDKYPVTFHLFQANNDFDGVYYYDNAERPIELHGTIIKDRKLNLQHNYNDGNEYVTETFDGTFNDSLYSGAWIYKGKKLNFSVTVRKDTGSLAFDYVWSSGKKKLATTSNMRDSIFFFAASIWPSAVSKHPSVPLLQKIIRTDFDEKNSKDEIGKILIKRKNETLNRTKQDLESGAPYELIDRIQVVFINPKLLSISHLNYGDYGGAHGMYATSYTCVDLVHNKQLKLSDILDTLAAKKTLESLLISNFRKDYNMKPGEKLENMLLTDNIPVNDNFLLTGKGIAFNYAPYELSAFSMGEITLFIPYKDINPYLKPGFKKLISN